MTDQPLLRGKVAPTNARGVGKPPSASDSSGSMPTCPNCKGNSGQVLDSRLNSEGTIRRRRVCNTCLHRFTTFEATDEMIKALRRVAKMRQMLLNMQDQITLALAATVSVTMEAPGGPQD